MRLERAYGALYVGVAVGAPRTIRLRIPTPKFCICICLKLVVEEIFRKHRLGNRKVIT